MDKKLITNEFNCYGGDHDRHLYLDQGIKGNMQLCLEGSSGNPIVRHITGTDPNYMNWLVQHHKSLLLIPSNKWYYGFKSNDDYYAEFHYTLNELSKIAQDISS